MNELLVEFTNRHSATYMEVVSFWLRNMSAEQLFQIPALRVSDAERATIEKWGVVFSIPVNGLCVF